MAYISSTATVYAGPSTGGMYPAYGTLAKNHEVAVLFKEGDFCYISYSVNDTALLGGYVRTECVANIPDTTEMITINAKNRYVKIGDYAYRGPSFIYDRIGEVQADIIVSYLGYKKDGYALIEYSNPGSGVYRRAFFDADNLCRDRMYKYTVYKKDDIIPAHYPMAGATVTQGFNDTFTRRKGHLGYDIVCSDAKVKALFAGTVVDVVDTGAGNGLVVCLRHAVEGREFYSAYCHLDSSDLSRNDNVLAGAVVGVMGNSGLSEPEDGSDNRHVHTCVFTYDYAKSSDESQNIAKVTDPMGYCGGETYTFEDCSTFYEDNDIHCYGPYPSLFPGCGGLCFYDPYGVVSTNGDVIYSRYDVNYDHVVDQLDLTYTQRRFGTADPVCDFNEDGIVDINELILILNNYTE